MNLSNTEYDVLRTAQEWLRQDLNVVLVTVVKTWGSSPRPLGSIMVICQDGRFAGSVSGGCVEEDLVARVCHDEIGRAFPTQVNYGVNREEADRFGLPCGGRLELLLEALEDNHQFSVLLEAVRAGTLMTRQVCLSTGEVSLHPASSESHFEFKKEYCRQIIGPAWQMLIIGAGHLSQIVAQMAQLLGYRVILCDPREEVSRNIQIDGVESVRLMPDEAVGLLSENPHSVILALSHDPKLDDMALMQALGSNAAYVGALGSQRSSRARRERLLQLGISEDQLAGLHAPVGLPLGGKAPAEIAVAILAEITAVRHHRQLVLARAASAA